MYSTLSQRPTNTKVDLICPNYDDFDSYLVVFQFCRRRTPYLRLNLTVFLLPSTETTSGLFLVKHSRNQISLIILLYSPDSEPVSVLCASSRPKRRLICECLFLLVLRWNERAQAPHRPPLEPWHTVAQAYVCVGSAFCLAGKSSQSAAGK